MTKSRRPYLIRAIFDWACDNGFTPHLLVAADYPGVVVPTQFIQDGRITLNISPAAVQNLNLDIEPIWFSARFGGKPYEIQVPSGSVIAAFARENGEGIIFGDTETVDPATEASASPEPEPPKPKRPQLRVIK